MECGTNNLAEFCTYRKFHKALKSKEKELAIPACYFYAGVA